MTLRQTHTYALLELSAGAYDEIKAKLLEAGYQHAINEEGEIDMHGIAVTRGVGVTPPTSLIEEHFRELGTWRLRK